MARTIDYGKLMHRAMRSLIQNVLHDIEANGLPGAHHFFITFDTKNPLVQIADWLKTRYPDEMTVVMQHWFDGLKVTDDGFFITLNFGDQPEPLYIPYDAIKTFVDPSVEFGLRFETNTDEAATNKPLPKVTPKPKSKVPDSSDKKTKTSAKDADVVSLDSFRK